MHGRIDLITLGSDFLDFDPENGDSLEMNLKKLEDFAARFGEEYSLGKLKHEDGDYIFENKSDGWRIDFSFGGISLQRIFKD
jgi:hypothetical protein